MSEKGLWLTQSMQRGVIPLFVVPPFSDKCIPAPLGHPRAAVIRGLWQGKGQTHWCFTGAHVSIREWKVLNLELLIVRIHHQIYNSFSEKDINNLLKQAEKEHICYNKTVPLFYFIPPSCDPPVLYHYWSPILPILTNVYLPLREGSHYVNVW